MNFRGRFEGEIGSGNKVIGFIYILYIYIYACKSLYKYIDLFLYTVYSTSISGFILPSSGGYIATSSTC